jgi:hypothetical protein
LGKTAAVRILRNAASTHICQTREGVSPPSGSQSWHMLSCFGAVYGQPLGLPVNRQGYRPASSSPLLLIPSRASSASLGSKHAKPTTLLLLLQLVYQLPSPPPPPHRAWLPYSQPLTWSYVGTCPVIGHQSGCCTFSMSEHQ